MDAAVRNIEQLFSTPVQYVIPQFQRFYDWEKEKQWHPLWDDVKNVADQVLAHPADDTTRVPPHFMGSLVLKGEQTPSVDIPTELGRRSIVVDGQQRLTTIQVLARAVVGTADGLGCHHAVTQLRALIANAELDEPWRYKVLQSHPRDINTYQRLMKDPTGDKSVKGTSILSHQQGIEACHDYFCTAVADYLDDEETRPQRIDALQQTISQHLQFAILTLEDDEQPNMVFETINARGQTLAQHQLVKSTVMYEADVVLDAKRATECWHAFEDDKWWGQHNQDSGHISKFLAAWLTSVQCRNIQTPRISTEFRAFLNQWKRDNEQIEPAFELLNHAGITYHNIITGIDTDYGPFYADMTAIGAQSPMPACLWMMNPTNKLDPDTAEKIVAILESYAFRRALVGNTTNFMPIIQTMACAIQENADVRETVRDSIREPTSARPEYWPEDKFIQEHVTFNPFKTGKPTQTILRRIENHLRAQVPAPPLLADATLVEHHLMPTDRDQWEPGRNWAIKTNRTVGTAKRSAAVRHIGNLTLIVGKRSDIKGQEAAPWQQKQELLQTGNALYINKELLEMDTWDENAITKRSAYIAELATQVWSR